MGKYDVAIEVYDRVVDDISKSIVGMNDVNKLTLLLLISETAARRAGEMMSKDSSLESEYTHIVKAISKTRSKVS